MADIDQGETTVALYALPQDRPGSGCLGQIARPSNLIDELEFSPTGDALVWAISEGVMWWLSDINANEYLPSPGGEFRAGEVCIWETPRGEPRSLRVIDVRASLPPGWLPQEPEKTEFEMIHGPFSLDNRRFRILLPTGEWRTYDLGGNELQDPERDRPENVRDVAYRSLRAMTGG